jgi:hypothetical protein
MLGLEEIERMLVNSIVVDARLDGPMDALVGHLLSRRSGHAGRPTDGVIFAHQLVSRQQLAATGVVVMIGQTIEPVRVALTLDAGRRRIALGRLCFGDASRTVAFGSSEHHKLRDRLIAEPDAEFAWKERFRRGEDGWHHDLG